MWPNPQETMDLVRFTEEILNGKFHCFCSAFAENVAQNHNFLNPFHIIYLLIYPLKTLEKSLAIFV